MAASCFAQTNEYVVTKEGTKEYVITKEGSNLYVATKEGTKEYVVGSTCSKVAVSASRCSPFAPRIVAKQIVKTAVNRLHGEAAGQAEGEKLQASVQRLLEVPLPFFR